MLSSHVEDLLTAAKEARKDPKYDKEALNRAISSLSNALYAFKYAETGTYSSFGTKRQEDMPTQRTEPINAQSSSCICIPGMIDRSCPVHGERK